MTSLETALLDALQSESEDDLFSEIATLVEQSTIADTCEIYIRGSDDSLVLRASTNAPGLSHRVRLGRGKGLCGKVFMTGEPLFISKHAYKHPDFAPVSGLDDVPLEGAVVLPMSDVSGPLGVLLLRKEKPWSLDDPTKESLLKTAALISRILAGYHKAWESGNRSTRLEALSEVAKTLATSPYLEEILQLLVNYTASQFHYKVCTVRLLDEQRGELVLRATQAPAKAYQRKGAIKLGESIAGRAIDSRGPVIVEDVLSEESYIGHDLAKEQGLRSMICIPLMIQERPVGVMSCYTAEVRNFPQDEVNALETLAKQAAVSIEHARLQVRHTLMQEMHHRVKNSLQQIASLLRLQMRHGKYKSLDEALNDSISRILAISSVHDLLSREDLDHVGIRSIAEMLVAHQQGSLMLPDRSISFKVSGQGDDIHLAIAQATQVALVLNELIQNAVEHGFKTATEGEIHVTVEEADELVKVWVSNSGDLVPKDFDPTKANLGLQIVEMFAKSLGGKFRLREVMGWSVAELFFPRVTGE